MNEAKKNDDGKPRVDLVPFDAIEAAGEILGWAARSKYAAWNWTQGEGLAWHKLIRAALSHLGKWAMGEDRDPESGFSHAAHALCCLMFLVTYERRKHGVDDRPRLPWFAQNEGTNASSDTIPACGEPGVMHFENETETVVKELVLDREVIAQVAQVGGAVLPMRGRICGVLKADAARVRFTRDDGTYFDLVCLGTELKKPKPAPSSEPAAKGQEELALGDEVIEQSEGWHAPRRGRIVGLNNGSSVVVRFTRDNASLDQACELKTLRKVMKQENPKRDDLTACPHCGESCYKVLGKCSPPCTAPEARTKTVRVPGQGGGYVVIEVCLTCGRKAGQCTATGGDLLCNSVIEPFPHEEDEEDD